MNRKPINIFLVGADEYTPKRLNEIVAGSETDIFRIRQEPFKSALISLARKNEYSIILLDLAISDRETLASIKQLHAIVPDLPIIVLINKTDKGFYSDVLENGAQDYLIKGIFDDELFFRAIRYSLEIKSSEKSLKKIEKQFAESQSMARIGSWHWDSKLNTMTWSTELTRIFGLKPEELGATYEDFLSLIHLEDRELFISIFEKAKNDFQRHDCIYRIVRPDGSLAYIHCTGEAIVDETGILIGLAGTAQDITDRTLAEESFHRNVNLLNAVIEGTSDVIFVKDLESRYLLINTAGLNYLGKSREEVVGRGSSELMPAESARFALKSDQSIIQSGNAITDEVNMTFANVTRRFFFTKGPYRDRLGNIIGIIGIGRDITDRKSSEEKLQSEYAFRKAIGDSVGVGIVAADLKGQLIFVNPAFCKMVGWTEKELIGSTPPFAYWPPEEIENIMKGFNMRFSKNRPSEIEHTYCRRNGERFPVSVMVSQLTGGQGELIGNIALFYDLTEKKRIESESLKVQKLESLGVLAGGIAHDFNNILTGILGNISLAKTWSKPEGKVYKRLREAEKASMRAADLSKQLLTFAKGGTPNKRTASLQNVLEESVRFALRGTNVRSTVSLEEGLNPVEIDENQIGQVIHNLIINAQQAMPQGGVIQLNARNFVAGKEESKDLSLREGNYVEISIQDEGSGISNENLTKVFDPYFTTKQKGSGLGLAISHSIIQRHEGHICFKSIFGVGTTFLVYLPANPAAGVNPIKPEEDLIKGYGKVLVVDDEEFILDVANQMLRTLGYQATTSIFGTDAVTKYKSSIESGNRFNVVITDLTIPGDISGVEVLKRIQEIDSEAKVIVSSGYADDPVISEYKKFGFVGCIVKPYRIHELGRVLNSVLEKI